MIFAFFYFVLSVFLHIVFLPYLLYISTKQKYKLSIPHRFFGFSSKFVKSGVWFHGCSYGEIVVVQNIINSIKITQNINISTITDTGYKKAKQICAKSKFLPFESILPFWISKQKVLVVIEAELWYMLFFIAKLKGIKTVLVNARISDRSYKKYLKNRWFYKKIFKNIDKIFAQSDTDKQRLEQLGAKNIETVGNIKLSIKPKITQKYDKPKDSFLVVAASTHETEEQLVLDAWSKNIGKLIIVPRHPQRFERVDNLILDFIKNKNITYQKFSINKSFDTDIILLDSLGELINIYAISDAVILGGAFAKIGGHNPVEPAYFQNIIITGEHIFNQYALFESISAYEIVNKKNLQGSLKNIKTLNKAKLLNKGDTKDIINYIKKATYE
ncbi:MAG: 3-deoxy-D-manno-octulosonic acid transferase [Epsilonproteobacteria bacterium]|nr:MAG: 3-deoxy-D-manno-octulosonic acid transferase [Campylobacterota bacterium]